MSQSKTRVNKKRRAAPRDNSGSAAHSAEALKLPSSEFADAADNWVVADGFERGPRAAAAFAARYSSSGIDGRFTG